MRSEIGGLRSEIEALRAAMRQGFAELELRLTKQIIELHTPRGVNPPISISPPTRQDPEMDAILHNLAQQPMKTAERTQKLGTNARRSRQNHQPPATSHQPRRPKGRPAPI